MGDFGGLKAGMVVYTRQAFPPQGAGPVTESEGLMCVSRNLFFRAEKEVTSGR